jgi:orotidine-5'-phosphate decarboxylase
VSQPADRVRRRPPWRAAFQLTDKLNTTVRYYCAGKPVWAYTYRQMAEAVLYGELIHVTAEQHRVLRDFQSGDAGTGMFMMKAVLLLLLETSKVAVQVDALLAKAIENGELTL